MQEHELKFFKEISEEHLATFRRVPRVRVRMVENQESLDFEVKGHFVVTDEQNQVLDEDFAPDTIWRAHVDAFTPPNYRYLLFVIEVFQEDRAKKISESLRQLGFNAWHKSFGYRVITDDDSTLFDVYRYRVFIGPEQTKHAARNIQVRLLGMYGTQIFKIPYKQARGILELYELRASKSIKGSGFIRLKPKTSDARIIVHGIRNFGKRMPYSFKNAVEFHINEEGKLFLVGELDLEEYITGLMSALYDPNYPPEFLKAMDIAFRSSVLANLGMTHMNEPFDFCRTEHCFPFEWEDQLEPELATIVDETRGKFLIKGDKLCDAKQHLICGGHTEHIDIIMNRDTRNSITGRFDIENLKSVTFPLNLSNETEAEKWLHEKPPVLCNYHGKPLDAKFHFSRDYFRWVMEYSRQELEAILQKKTEEDIGTIFDIVPLLRGGSGRLLEVEVLGSHRNLHLIGDHEIRSCLSETMLPSSCFVIETRPGVDGTPDEITFIGAGKGHGVGLCQAGAIAMAQEGADYMKILEHYFGKVELVPEWPTKPME